MSRVAEMMNTVYHKHLKKARRVVLEMVFFPVCDKSLWGLGTTVGIRCSFCDYNDQFKLFEETVCAPQRGRKATEINLQLGAFLTSQTPIP